MKVSIHLLRGVLVFASRIVFPCDSFAQPPRGADCVANELLPGSVVICAEVPDLGAALGTVLNHPLREKIKTLPAYEGFMASGALTQLQVGVRAFEASMGKPWQEAITLATDRGITVALDASGGAAVLLHSSDAELLERLRGFLLAVGQMQGAPAKQAEYREFVVDGVGKDGKLVRMHDWLLLTNQAELGKAIVDQYLDRDGDTLATNETYLSASKELHSSDAKHRVFSAFLDIKTLRDAGVAKDIFKEKTDNFAGEVLLGGVLANLRQALYVTGQMYFSDNGLSLKITTPHRRDWESPREYYFGGPEVAVAPPLLEVPNRLFAISTHRDLSQMWLRSGDLLTDRGNEQLAAADTMLTTFFSGRDFGEDILGSLDSAIQIVGTEQDFSQVLPQPAIKFPAFALQFRMKTPEETKPELRRIFQSFVGFLNVTGAQNGQPQLDLGMEAIGEAELFKASYVPDKDERESLNAKVHFNFSPTLAFAGERIVFASSTSLARTLVDSQRSGENSKALDSNTSGILEATTMKRILQTNRSQLVANNMLEKGHSKEAAEGEIDLLLELVGFLRNVHLDLNFTPSKMELELAVDLKSDAEAGQ